MQYGWTNVFEAAALNDADRDRMAGWAEYLAGTDPTNRASKLKWLPKIKTGQHRASNCNYDLGPPEGGTTNGLKSEKTRLPPGHNYNC